MDSWQGLKQGWQTLNPRQRFTARLLAILLVSLWLIATLYLFYLRHQVKASAEYLIWLRQQQSYIVALQGGANSPHRSAKDVITQSLSAVKLLPHARIHFQNENECEIVFTQVSFDELIAWLERFSLKYAWQINRFNVSPALEPGIVQAQLILQIKKD